MAISGYDTIGPYTQGLWLVYNPTSKQAALASRAKLPPQGTGYKYYWLGTGSQGQTVAQLNDAEGKFGIVYGGEDLRTPVSSALKNGTADLPGAPTGLAGILHQLGEAAAIGPLGNVAKALGAAGAEAGAAGAGAEAGAAGAGAAGAATSGLATDAGLAGLAAAVGAGISGVFNQLVKDAGYAALLVVVLIVGGALVLGGLHGASRKVAE